MPTAPLFVRIRAKSLHGTPRSCVRCARSDDRARDRGRVERSGVPFGSSGSSLSSRQHPFAAQVAETSAVAPRARRPVLLAERRQASHDCDRRAGRSRSAGYRAGKAKFRRSDFWVHVQSRRGLVRSASSGSLPALVGLIIAFISAVQLGALARRCTLPASSVSRWFAILAAVMVAIVVAGRTGAAFAAELGTMRVTQEINALTHPGPLTRGVSGVRRACSR